MANTDAKMGFRLISVGGKRDVTRRARVVDGATALALAIGDAYTVEADGNIARANVGTLPINGIVESFEVDPKSGQGPESIDYLPASTAGRVIGIEDRDAEFEVQITTVAAADFDTGALGAAGALVDLVDAAPDATLRQSRQTVVLGGDQMVLVKLIDRPDNAVGANAKVAVKLHPLNVI